MKPRLRIAPSDLGDMHLFSTVEAEARGISRRDLGVMVRRELIWRVARGWYSSRVDAGPEERHILRAVAVLRLHGDATAAHRHTAVLIHGLPLARTNLSTVEIAKGPPTHGRAGSGLRLSEADLEQVGCSAVRLPDLDTSVLSVDPATAIVGTALTNNPLGALVAGDHALRLGVCTQTQIDAALDAARGSAGVARARETLVHLEPRHESPGETLTAAVLRRSSWTFEPQVEVVAAGHLYRLDFGSHELQLAIEFDGQSKYTGPEAMEEQIVRENNLRAEGWSFVRFEWADFEDEQQMMLRIVDAVHACQRAA